MVIFHLSQLDFLDHPFESLDSPVYSTQVFPDEEKPEVTEPTEEPMKKDGKKSKKIKKDLKSTNLPKFILKAFRGQIGWKKKIYKGHEN